MVTGKGRRIRIASNDPPSWFTYVCLLAFGLACKIGLL